MAIEKEHRTLLLGTSASLFCTPLMVAGVNGILPEIGRSLQASAMEASLIGAIYSLGLAVFQLACGSLGDIWGHKRIFLYGCLIFCLSSATLGFITQLYPFLCIRFVQGVGAAMTSAAGMTLVASAAKAENRAAYLGFSAIFVYAGIACGPPIAGLIAGVISWRWLFWFTAFFSLLIFFLMKHYSEHEWRTAQDMRYDWQGCLLYAIAMGALTSGASCLKFSLLVGSGLFAIFAVFLLLFYLREKKGTFPILNMTLLSRNRVFALSCLAAFVNYASFFGLIFYFSFYLQAGKGLSVRETGFILAIQALSQALATPFATKLCKNGREGKISAFGAALCGLGLLAAAFLELDTPLYGLISAQILLGSGVSIFSLANTAIILEAAGRANTGQASAMTGAVRTAGQLSSMVLITLSTSFFLGSEAINSANLNAFMASMHSSLFFFGVLNLAAVAISLVRNRN